MSFLPIVERELRVAARRASTYWIRFYAALGVLVLVIFLLVTAQQVASARLGQQLFIAVGVVSLGFALLAGVFLTADCLSEEKREGTLGLLFLTDLNGYDVVLGKLAATSLHALYALLAVFPLLGLPLLMGGVTGGEFGRVVLVLLVTLFLSLALGMFVSAGQREARQAMSGTFVGLLIVSGLLPAAWWLQVVVVKTGWTPLLLWPSPVYAYSHAFDLWYGVRGGSAQFWGSIQMLAGLSLACLLGAALRLPRVWREGELTLKAPAPAPLPAAERSCQRGPLLDRDPALWLAGEGLARGRLPWGLVWVLTVLWFLFLLAGLQSSTRWREAVIASFFISYALHQVVKYLIAVEATRQFSQDKQSGALELLLVTPLSEQAMIAAQVRTLTKRFAGLQSLLAAINLVMAGAVVLASGPLHMGKSDQTIFLELYLGGLLMLLLDTRTLIRVGLWMALRTNKQHRAVLGTLCRVLVPPWVGILLLVFLLQGMRSGPGAAMFLFGCWFAFGIGTDAVLAARAQAALAGGLRPFLTGFATAWPPRMLAPTDLQPQRA